MARNKVQFQRGLSEAQFAARYGTEDQCREAVMCWRWPSGFVCPVCRGKHHSVIKTRALYHLTQSKGGISSIELGRRLGVTQTTAWKIKHKLMQVMMERDAVKRLTGRIEVDDADRGCGRNHTRGQANPFEIAPRGGFPPRGDHCLGEAQFQFR